MAWYAPHAAGCPKQPSAGGAAAPSQPPWRAAYARTSAARLACATGNAGLRRGQCCASARSGSGRAPAHSFVHSRSAPHPRAQTRLRTAAQRPRLHTVLPARQQRAFEQHAALVEAPAATAGCSALRSKCGARYRAARVRATPPNSAAPGAGVTHRQAGAQLRERLAGAERVRDQAQLSRHTQAELLLVVATRHVTAAVLSRPRAVHAGQRRCQPRRCQPRRCLCARHPASPPHSGAWRVRTPSGHAGEHAPRGGRVGRCAEEAGGCASEKWQNLLPSVACRAPRVTLFATRR